MNDLAHRRLEPMDRVPGRARTALRRAALVLAGLAAPAVTLAQGTAYVTSEKDAALTLIDLATLSVKGTLPTCQRGRHVQLTAQRLLLVACGESGAADVIDPATGRSLRRIPLGDDPEAFDLSPDGRTLYVSNEDDGTVGFVDVASGRRLKSVPVGQEPEGVKVSADGRTLYVTSEVAGLVHVIDVASAAVVQNIKVGKRPRRMALTPDGAELWVTNELDASVSIVSTATRRVTATLRFELKGVRAEEITPVGIQIARDGRRAFVALGRANRVAFIDVAQRRVTDLVLVGKRAWNVALDKAEARLWVVNGLSDDVTVVDVAAARPIKTIAVGRVPYGLVVVE